MRSSLRAFDLHKYKSLAWILPGKGGGGISLSQIGAYTGIAFGSSSYCAIGSRVKVNEDCDIYNLKLMIRDPETATRRFVVVASDFSSYLGMSDWDSEALGGGYHELPLLNPVNLLQNDEFIIGFEVQDDSVAYRTQGESSGGNFSGVLTLPSVSTQTTYGIPTTSADSSFVTSPDVEISGDPWTMGSAVIGV